MYAAYEGVNLMTDPISRKFDKHCPLMGGHFEGYQRLNTYKTICEERQKNKTLWKDCYPKCRFECDEARKVVQEKPPVKYYRLSDMPLPMQKELRGKMLELHKNGETIFMLTKKFGYNKSTIAKNLRTAKLEERVMNYLAA